MSMGAQTPQNDPEQAHPNPFDQGEESGKAKPGP